MGTYKRSTGRASSIRSVSNTKVRAHIINAVAILVLAGPTWAIGFLMNLDRTTDGATRRVIAYIFVDFNAFQGLWIFIVFVIRPQLVRNLWVNLLCCRRRSSVWSTSESRSGSSGVATMSSSGGNSVLRNLSRMISRSNNKQKSYSVSGESA